MWSSPRGRSTVVRRPTFRLAPLGVKALPVACDVSKAERLSAACRYDGRGVWPARILVNNAGIAWVTDALDFPLDKWQRVLNLNLTGTFQLSQMAARVMKDHSGKIINIASIGGFRGDFPEYANSIAYTASKGALLAMTKDLAVKWAKFGITVNAICPGWFPTSLNDKHLEELAPKLLPRIPLGRYGGKEDLKGLVLCFLLASSASGYITGQYVVIDGGQTALT